MRLGHYIEVYPNGVEFRTRAIGIQGLRSQVAAAFGEWIAAGGELRPVDEMMLSDGEQVCGSACIWCGNCVRLGGKRDRIRGFSSDSRRRLRRLLMSIPWPDYLNGGNGSSVGWLGLTFKTAPTVTDAKLAMHRFMQAFYRRYPGGFLVWVMEFQKRGAPHFHVLLALPAGPDLPGEDGLKYGRKRRWPKGDRNGFLAWAIETWVRVTDEAAQSNSVNFDWAWDVMGLLKYLIDVTKDNYQKMPPPGVMPGRFWGYRRVQTVTVQPAVIWGYAVYLAALADCVRYAFGAAGNPERATIRGVFHPEPLTVAAGSLSTAIRAPPGPGAVGPAAVVRYGHFYDEKTGLAPLSQIIVYPDHPLFEVQYASA